MSTLRVNTLQDQAGTGQPDIDGLCKAWVNFNGTGTVAIRASYNVTSITDRGTGRYTANFTTAMSDNDYSVICIGDNDGYMYITEGNTSTTSVGVDANNMSNGGTDRTQISVAVFR